MYRWTWYNDTVATISVRAPVASGTRIICLTIVVSAFKSTNAVTVVVTISTTFGTGFIVVTTAPISWRVAITCCIRWKSCSRGLFNNGCCSWLSRSCCSCRSWQIRIENLMIEDVKFYEKICQSQSISLVLLLTSSCGWSRCCRYFRCCSCRNI